MRTRLPLALAALAAATAAAFANAQQHNYVQEPVSSIAAGTQGEALKPIVDALNADASMKGSKLTLVPDGEVLVLTGVTVTRDQMKRALEIASSQAPGGKVVNAITSEQLEILQTPVTVATVEPVVEGAEATDGSTSAAAEASSPEVIQSATPGEPPILPATAAPETAQPKA